MRRATPPRCGCNKVRLEVQGGPIVGVECCCASCRKAGGRLRNMPGAPAILTDHGTTRYELYRKDRVRFVDGTEHLKEYRLKPRSGTRRVVATCCNTPVFAEFQAGHWLSLYGHLWPDGSLPPAQVRIMTGDLDDPGALPDDIPPLTGRAFGFYAKLFGAWAAMGFRKPKIAVNGTLDL